MKLPACLLLVLASLLVGPRVVVADDVPEDTNKIESLTVEQATQLVKEFPGVQAQVELKGATLPVGGCLPLKGVKSLDADTAMLLAGFKGHNLSLSGLTTLAADAATTLVAMEKWNGHLPAFTAFESPDSVAVAEALATRKGQLALPNLTKISPKTLSALIVKEDIEIPRIKTLQLIPEPDGSPTEDFVIPERFRNR